MPYFLPSFTKINKNILSESNFKTPQLMAILDYENLDFGMASLVVGGRNQHTYVGARHLRSAQLGTKRRKAVMVTRFRACVGLGNGLYSASARVPAKSL
jgi:hypothetical protein